MRIDFEGGAGLNYVRRHPDKSYQVDHKNQSTAMKAVVGKEHALKLLLYLGGPAFVLAIVFMGFKQATLGAVFLYLAAGAFIGTVLYLLLPIPAIRCSRCNRRMKMRSFDEGGGYAANFLVCDECKLYVDTGYSSD